MDISRLAESRNEFLDWLNKTNLRIYQKTAIEECIKSLISGNKKTLVQMVTGSGKTLSIIMLVKFLHEYNFVRKVNFITKSRAEADQLQQLLYQNLNADISCSVNSYHNERILVSTYYDITRYASHDLISTFDLIVCYDSETIHNEKLKQLFDYSESYFIGLTSVDLPRNSNSWFCGLTPVYSYTLYKDPIGEKFERFCLRLINTFEIDQVYVEPQLDIQVFTIEPRISDIKPDFLIVDSDFWHVIEAKPYRSRLIPRNIIRSAIEQSLSYKKAFNENRILWNEKTYKHIDFILIMLCEVDEDIKDELLDRENLSIWDIKNLLFLCRDNQELYNELTEISYFPTANIQQLQPKRVLREKNIDTSPGRKQINEVQEECKQLINELTAIKPGNASSAEYEIVCTNIIKYLFENEFTKFSAQHKTDDELFRMDLLCGLKGSSTFWRFLIRFYNTKFIVFEFKNYTDMLSQNLIYIVEKYLFNAALRNVAIMISRKGFDKNAQLAALGCLKEDGKLIIDITDDDLIYMLEMKADGLEPSDYILSKVEDLLMSVGK